MGRKKGYFSYDDVRRKNLLADNIQEDKVIRTLEKKLKLKRRRKNQQQKQPKHPTWLRQYGLDYILDFEQDIESKNEDPNQSEILGIAKSKNLSSSEIYGEQMKPSCHGDDLDNEASRVLSNGEKTNKNDLSDQHSTDDDITAISKVVRACFNRLSETQMAGIVNQLTGLFTSYPKASVRQIIIDEVYKLLKLSPIDTRCHVNWLHQELAVCLSCLHISLHVNMQHDLMLGCLVERLLADLSSSDASQLASFSIYLAYLFRFEVLSSQLICDLLQRHLEAGLVSNLQACHYISIAVGANLRKSNLSAVQLVVKQANSLLQACKDTDVELSCELEGMIKHLSAKRSTEECASKSAHLKRSMKSWINGSFTTGDYCLTADLVDFSSGQWRSRVNTGQQLPTEPSSSELPMTISGDRQVDIRPEIEAAANRLGLRTLPRRLIFNSLVSTVGGPEATAKALVASANTNGTSSSLRERETVQIILHSLMSEQPFNRFYPRVLGSLLSFHRRFLMIIKCAFWDVMKRSDLSIESKTNAGRAIGLLVAVYDLPFTIIKNFNFGDPSESNIALLRHTIAELCSSSCNYTSTFSKFAQLASYTRLGRNCRIFIRKHFPTELDANLRAVALRLADDMRDAEQV